MNDIKEIKKRNKEIDLFWKRYLELEKEFLDTEYYVSIDKINGCTFSSKYMSLLEVICIEIECVSKYLLYVYNLIEEIENIDQIKTEFLNKGYLNVLNTKININNYYLNNVWGENEKIPKWWTIHNKIKHCRYLKTDNIENYKLANQFNVLSALAALYNLEILLYKLTMQYNKDNNSDLFLESFKGSIFQKESPLVSFY